MHLVCFDIDGTLVASVDFDCALYARAIREVLGRDVDTNWDAYKNVTDSGIFDEVFDIHGLSIDRAQAARRAESIFTDFTKRYLAENPNAIREIRGARELVEALRERPGVSVAVATGGWAETARLKLRAIGLDPESLPMATGSDAPRRTEIMRLAASRALNGTDAVRKTFFGDGTWDLRAANELGYDFIAVGDAVRHHTAFDDLRDTKAILCRLGV